MTAEETSRKAAISRLKAKRDFKMHLGAYLIVNAMLVAIWALSGRNGLWPAWVIVFWGVGLAFNGWHAYLQKPITEAEIRREMGPDP